MASRVWLLVEWVDESDIFPSYGVVNVDTLAYDEAELNPGNLIFIRVKHDNPRQAKILRISENKRYVKEQKEILERQDHQVKNVLQLCMRTIKGLKSDSSFTSCTQQASTRSPLPHVIVAQNDNSGSDSDTEPTPHPIKIEHNRTRDFSKSTPKYNTHYSRKESIDKQARASLNPNYSRRRSMISSTPLPSNNVQENIKLSFDQATQTEGEYQSPFESTVEDMETVLKNLYIRFNYLVSQANIINANASMSESEHNDDGSYIDPNAGESLIEPNNTVYEQVEMMAADVGEIGAEELIEETVQNHGNSSMVQGEDKVNPNALRVRRMSAQTTNNIEATTDDLVPIGHGNAKVPARLLHDIDWSSYTSATRQLLQAVFPRRVLATHSLTGKQSPAFLNKPPKNILDPVLVADIVQTVSTRCGVPKSLVRNSITIKCTDEAKLYRNRLQYKRARNSLHPNGENIPPTTTSSDESHAVMN